MKLGVVADDVTGAADLADAVCDQGWSASLTIGVPRAPLPAGDCAVIALASRTAPVDAAVGDSVNAARALLDAGAPLLYQKYCSTFDSTDAGNIGPVADALRALVGARCTAGTPATPRVGRTVYQGHLFVDGRLLAESPLRDHPLTPMRDSDLLRLLARQTPAPVRLVDRATVARGVDAVADVLAAADGHVLLDALDDGDLDVVAAAVLQVAGRLPLVAGGAAGLAAALARADRGAAIARSSFDPPPAGDARRLIVSGSCSARTQQQVAAFGGTIVRLRAGEAVGDPGAAQSTALAEMEAAYRAGARTVLVSSTAPPDEVAAAPPGAAGRLETLAGSIAAAAVARFGVRRLLVAGGETSGAVAAALGLTALRVGPSAGPGLPWLVPAGSDDLALLLKSGNFGPVDLFATAWDACP